MKKLAFNTLKRGNMNINNDRIKFNLDLVDENEHLIPRPFGTLQTLNLDHLYRYAFAKGYCYNVDVLDAAMGCGYSSLILNCKSYMGIDIDPNMVAFANEYYLPLMNGKANYLEASVLQLPIEDKSKYVYIYTLSDFLYQFNFIMNNPNILEKIKNKLEIQTNQPGQTNLLDIMLWNFEINLTQFQLIMSYFINQKFTSESHFIIGYYKQYTLTNNQYIGTNTNIIPFELGQSHGGHYELY